MVTGSAFPGVLFVIRGLDFRSMFLYVLHSKTAAADQQYSIARKLHYRIYLRLSRNCKAYSVETVEELRRCFVHHTIAQRTYRVEGVVQNLILLDMIGVHPKQFLDTGEDRVFRFRDSLRNFVSVGLKQRCAVQVVPSSSGIPSVVNRVYLHT